MPRTAEAQTVMPSEKTWNAILKLAHEGQDCEKRIDDLQKARADLKGRLAEKGLEASESASWKSLGSSFALVELTLESERARLKNLSRQSNALVSKAAQARILEDEEVDEILAGDPQPEAPLYDKAMTAASKAGYKPDVGEKDEDAEKRETAKGDPSSGGVPKGDPLAAVSIADVLAEHPSAVERLKKSNIVTLADAAKVGKAELVSKMGISSGLANQIMTRIQQLRSMEPGDNGKHSKRGRKAREN